MISFALHAAHARDKVGFDQMRAELRHHGEARGDFGIGLGEGDAGGHGEENYAETGRGKCHPMGDTLARVAVTKARTSGGGSPRRAARSG